MRNITLEIKLENTMVDLGYELGDEVEITITKGNTGQKYYCMITGKTELMDSVSNFKHLYLTNNYSKIIKKEK